MLKRSLLTLALFCITGCGMPSLLITPVQRQTALEEIEVARGNGNAKIVVIPIEGLLSNSRGAGLLQPGDNKIDLLTQQLDRAERDKSVKAVVLRVNSPGGTVTGSDNMYELLKRFRAKSGKPIVASVQEIGASGGYYVSLSADKIVASPTSVVGSIGVIFNAFSVEQGLGKLGIKSEVVKSGPMKDMASPFHDMSDAERKVMQATVDEYFARFRGLVAERRHFTDEASIARVSDGRVFSGAEAKKLGLIDDVGILEDAIDEARTLANAKDGRAIMYRKPFGPGGSIYASNDAPLPQAGTTLQLPIPATEMSLPTGFYYMWRP
jgi:protease IV